MNHSGFDYFAAIKCLGSTVTTQNLLDSSFVCWFKVFLRSQEWMTKHSNSLLLSLEMFQHLEISPFASYYCLMASFYLMIARAFNCFPQRISFHFSVYFFFTFLNGGFCFLLLVISFLLLLSLLRSHIPFNHCSSDFIIAIRHPFFYNL